MGMKILIITGDAGESYETLYAIHRFQEAGHTPVVAAPSKRALHMVIHDFAPGWDTYIERKGYVVNSEVTFENVNPEEYDAVLCIGGRAPEYLRNDMKVRELVRHFYDNDKWVWAICHGIQILISSGIADGLKMTCYEHVKFELAACGGEWMTEEAVRDGRIVTGQTWQSHPEFYRLVFECIAEGVPA